MEMKASTLVLLTGGSPTKTMALLEDIGTHAEITQRQLQHASSKMTDKIALDEHDTARFLAAMEAPQGALQELAAKQYATLESHFHEITRSAVFAGENMVGAVPQFEEPVTEPEPVVEDGDDDELELELFDAPEEEVVEEPAPEPVVEVETADDLPWEDDGDLDFLDEPSVGAEPVSYDRTDLESDGEGSADKVTETTVDEEDDEFGDLFE